MERGGTFPDNFYAFAYLVFVCGLLCFVISLCFCRCGFVMLIDFSVVCLEFLPC